MCLNPKGPAWAGFAPNCGGNPPWTWCRKGSVSPLQTGLWVWDRHLEKGGEQCRPGAQEGGGRGRRLGEATGTPWTVGPAPPPRGQTGALTPKGGSEMSTATFPSAARWPHPL